MTICGTINIESSNYISAFYLRVIGMGFKNLEWSSIAFSSKEGAEDCCKSRLYCSYPEPICKTFNLVKVPDMYTCAVWNFYYKLVNNLSPIYFKNCKPTLPRIDELYNFSKPCSFPFT